MFAMKELHNMVVSACCAVPSRLEQQMSTMTASVGHKGARREILRVCHFCLGFIAKLPRHFASNGMLLAQPLRHRECTRVQIAVGILALGVGVDGLRLGRSPNRATRSGPCASLWFFKEEEPQLLQLLDLEKQPLLLLILKGVLILCPMGEIG